MRGIRGRVIFTIILCFIFVGCGGKPQWKVQRGSFINQSQKTMTVSPTYHSRLFDIKQKLREDGWKLKIADIRLEEETQSEKKSVTEVKFETKYRLIFRVPAEQRDRFGHGTFLTVVDNEKNEMVIEIYAAPAAYMDGKELGEILVDELRKTK